MRIGYPCIGPQLIKLHSRHNPRKMVRVWAEKEMRNLKRLQTAGIRCPEPVEVRENVLVMTFVGDKDGWCVRQYLEKNYPIQLMILTGLRLD